MFTTQPQQGGIFGQSQSKPFGGTGTASSGGPGLFGTAQPNPPAQQGGGIFGTTSTQPQSTGAFGAATSTNSAFLGTQPAATQGTGAFGGFSQGQSTQGGIFGQQQPQQQQTATSGVFGGATQQQPQQQGGIFGTSSAFGQGQGAQGQGQGMFGQGTQGQQQPQGQGIFGQQTGGQSQYGRTTSAFTTTQPQQQTNPFGSNPTSQGTGAGIFGAPTQGTQGTQGAGIFGTTGATNPQQPSSQGGLFGTFAPSSQPAQQTQGTSLFGGANSNPQGGQSFNSTGITLVNTTPANKLGGTSWGVPTNQPNGAQSMQPIRSKNPKLDAKHLVKCISGMEQFLGSSKEELRINFIQSGGQQPALSQQPQTMATGAGGFAKPANPLTTIPSFGGSTNLGGGTTTQSTLFGGQTQQPQQGGTLFGGQKPAQTQGAYGTTSATSSLFPSSAGGQSTLFGGGTQPQQTQQSTLFGGQTPQQQQPQSTLFGGGQTSQPSLLGGATGGTMFGSPPGQTGAPSLFGGSASPLQAPPLLATTNPTAPSLFGGAQPAQPGYQPQATPQLAPNPMNTNPSTFASMMAPFFQPNQPMDPQMQLLLPQMLYGAAMAQAQQNQGQTTPGAPQPQTNPFDIMSKLFASMGQTKTDENKAVQEASANPNIFNPTPFDEFMKEQNSKAKPHEKISLFSEAEVRQFQDLNARSYLDRIYHPHEIKEEQFKLRHSYQAQERKVDPLSEANYKIISRNYKHSQEQARKKYTPKNEELPDFGNFTVSPSMDTLKNMTVSQLKKVQNVKISNSFGTVQFLQPISLYKLELSDAVKIAQDNIEILQPELEEKRVRMTFVNFGNFSVLKPNERVKLLKKMRSWINQCDMIQISHNGQNGELIVETED